MNNPYPSNSILREETVVADLLAEQAIAVTAFQDIIRTARTAYRALHFPLGCPAAGFDIEDIDADMTAWLIGEDDDFLQAWAQDDCRAREAA